MGVFSAGLPTPAVRAAEPNLQWQLTPLDLDGPIPYFIAPGLEEHGYRARDAELAEWALEHWSRATGATLCFYPSIASKALIRIYWSPVGEGRFGQMQSIAVGLRRGGEVYVRPQLEQLEAPWARIAQRSAEDPLFREAAVYLTLLHEIGHVLGLVHTTNIEDAMYFGGDPLSYFERYRARLDNRADIRSQSAISITDEARLRLLYPPDLWEQVRIARERARAVEKSARQDKN